MLERVGDGDKDRVGLGCDGELEVQCAEEDDTSGEGVDDVGAGEVVEDPGDGAEGEGGCVEEDDGDACDDAAAEDV